MNKRLLSAYFPIEEKKSITQFIKKKSQWFYKEKNLSSFKPYVGKYYERVNAYEKFPSTKKKKAENIFHKSILLCSDSNRNSQHVQNGYWIALKKCISWKMASYCKSILFYLQLFKKYKVFDLFVFRLLWNYKII